MANEEHLAILMQGVEAWNKWREKYPKIQPNLSNADLRESNLNGSNLSKANLNGADLSGSRLRESDLGGAYLRYTYLSGANLSRAYLSKANLQGADLQEADLTAAHLNVANLSSVRLRGADLSRARLSMSVFNEARIGWTIWGNVDLSEVKGLETVTHQGPSVIGIDTFYRSKGKIPEVFLRGAGVPDTFITFMKSLTGVALDFYSCFIGHSSHDKAFVERLYADLQAKGVRCWYAPEDLKIGEPFLLGIDQGIRLHDKLLLVLSEHSVASGWVQHEVLSAMAKEQGKAPWVLFPIRVDDAIMNTSVAWATMIKQSRHIGDFTCWKDHDAYQKAFERLLRDLKAQ